MRDKDKVEKSRGIYINSKQNRSVKKQMQRSTWLLGIAATLLAFAYLLQTASPLRLNTDSILLLSMSASAADGKGFLFHSGATRFPTGYPAIVALLDRMGLASSGSMILLNCAFVAATLIAYYIFCRYWLDLPPRLSTGLCSVVMLSFVLVKHVTMPLGDVSFLGLFTIAVLLTTRVQDAGGAIHWKWLGLALIVTAAAITVRTIGISLLPAFAWILMAPFLSRAGKSRSIRWSLIFSLLIAALICGFFITQTRYFAETKAVYFQRNPAAWLLKNLFWHVTELGEIGINIPAAKVPALLLPAFLLGGLLITGLILRGLWLRRRSFGTWEITFLTYSGLIFVWPYFDNRFWLPILPLIVVLIAQALIEAARLECFKFIAIALCIWFSVAGTAAIVYSTRISWAGTRFVEFYGNGSLRGTYRAAYFGQPNIVEDKDALLLLKRYDPRAAKVKSE